MSIIGINGKIGSGKDTVGRIIQYLTSEYKDKYDFVEWIDRVENYGSNAYSSWEIKKFAGKLKQIGSILSGIVADQFEDQEFKKLYMGVDWDMTYREFLQKLGTEAMRDGLHTNVWVNALFSDYTPINIVGNIKPRKGGIKYLAEMPNWIITDMRFPNEMEAIEKREGVTIRVVRPGTSTGTHASETALDDAYFDHVISNNGTFEDLIEKVRQILTIERII